jgi:hypothetical protein
MIAVFLAPEVATLNNLASISVLPRVLNPTRICVQALKSASVFDLNKVYSIDR